MFFLVKSIFFWQNEYAKKKTAKLNCKMKMQDG